jgi:hypothetical protein
LTIHRTEIVQTFDGLGLHVRGGPILTVVNSSVQILRCSV